MGLSDLESSRDGSSAYNCHRRGSNSKRGPFAIAVAVAVAVAVVVVVVVVVAVAASAAAGDARKERAFLVRVG
ncbi:hypothetical protein M0804_014607 [Polistes exclamans]|nr:hypothetical protein M0804_014609 [Polistes exclamans]KAI4474917.1 hypothetical protein M0804_014607 [Polistes exclamans]